MKACCSEDNFGPKYFNLLEKQFKIRKTLERSKRFIEINKNVLSIAMLKQ